MNRFTKFWNKKNLLNFLYKKYKDFNFKLTVDESGNNYILLWKEKKQTMEDLHFAKEISNGIFNSIQEFKRELKMYSTKVTPFISVVNSNQHLGHVYNKISFPYQRKFSNADFIIKELINLILILGKGNNILKGSSSAYLCYGIGDRIPYDLNFSSPYKLIYSNIKSIINYCNMNELDYKTNFNLEKYSLEKGTNKIGIYIKIQNLITITFDNWVEFYENNKIVVVNNIPTYTLELLTEFKRNKIRNYILPSIDQFVSKEQEYKTLLEIEYKLKKIKK